MTLMHSAFPGQLRPNRSGPGSTQSPNVRRSVSTSILSSRNTSGNKDRRAETRSARGSCDVRLNRSGRSLIRAPIICTPSGDREADCEDAADRMGVLQTALNVIDNRVLGLFHRTGLAIVSAPRLFSAGFGLLNFLLDRKLVGKTGRLTSLPLQGLQDVVMLPKVGSEPGSLIFRPTV